LIASTDYPAGHKPGRLPRKGRCMTPTVTCSFCLQEADDAIEGPAGAICPGCVDLCVSVIERRKNPHPNSPEFLALKAAIDDGVMAATAGLKSQSPPKDQT
jgi:hypothetical protein